MVATVSSPAAPSLPASSVLLYRAVGPLELADLQTRDEFRPGPPSFQGKWFAESASDAARWGRRFYQFTGDPFHLVVVEVPTSVADNLFRVANLDRIGPARFADVDELPTINASKRGPIVELTLIPTLPP